MRHADRISLTLFILRISVFAVMAMWTLDKFVRPQHGLSIFERFYGWGGLGTAAMYTFAALESVLLFGFVAGFAQRLTYGAVLIIHAVSTLASYRQYLHPFDNANLLFFAAWPMLGACFALYTLRDMDTRWRIARHSGPL